MQRLHICSGQSPLSGKDVVSQALCHGQPTISPLLTDLRDMLDPRSSPPFIERKAKFAIGQDLKSVWINTMLASPWDFTYQGISRVQSSASRSSVAVYSDWDILSEVNERFPTGGTERVFTPPPFMGLGYLPEGGFGGSGQVVEAQKGDISHCGVEGFRGPDRFSATPVRLHSVECMEGSGSATFVLGGRMSEGMVLKTLILGGWS